ncbi:3'-5' exonuclease [Candidatus Marinarcus aquaticus]|uniref:DNA polymerase III subunit epsilon n=1 Tax=Candidatus Marinarcus aquaticus TaxID=2044504 RepID=A0A4V1LP49_9BACT|nr:3'-5' exonuclease [Candidatus Marinarcus aquaticus]RXJ59958.1 DNA polymerase III subunit epsilon [Candidatus Marinarcus aquaticus]
MKSRKKRHPQVNALELLVNKLRKRDYALEEFLELLSKIETNFFENPQLELELLISNGLPIVVENDKVSLLTSKRFISEQTFCIVDIETNGSNAHKGQIIELGAVKIKNGKVIEQYDSLVYAKDIPAYVQDVTNITPDMLVGAPPLKEVLEEFKLFLEDDVFVAHDIKFDYKFISDSFEKYDLGKLQNRKLCTIDLAKRTIFAQRYGLDFLKELLDIDTHKQHRALNDAISTTHIFENSLKNLPKEVKTVEELIVFSKSDNILKS